MDTENGRERKRGRDGWVVAVVWGLMILAASGGLGVAALPAEVSDTSSKALPKVSGTSGLVRLAEHSWAWVAQDARSSNGALFVGETAALVVDPGLTPGVAAGFFAAVRRTTRKPVAWVVLTHGHLDHALGTVCVRDGQARPFELIAHPEARRAIAEHAAAFRASLVASTPIPEERADLEACRLQLPEAVLTERRTFDLGGFEVEVFHPGTGHTPGDLVVWAASERVLVTGDLFLHDSSPYMGEGSTEGWISALGTLLALAPEHVVPGHFVPGSAQDLDRFRAYLEAQVARAEAAVAAGKSPAEHAEAIALHGFPGFSGFAQYPQYEATFADNARVVAAEVVRRPARPGEAGGFRVRKVLDVGEAPHQIAFSADGRRAFVAAAGSEHIGEVDVETLEVIGSRPVSGTPLGVVELPSGDLAVAQFRGAGLARLPAGGGEATAELATGEGSSLLVGPVPGPFDGVRYLISTESVDRLRVLDAENFVLIAEYPTGGRPFPPGVTSDGRLAFVPAYDDGTVTVIDLWNRRVLDTVAVGQRPSGASVLLGDVEVAVAVRGENRLVFLNTASHRLTGELSAGIGEGPFSVVVSPDGRLAFVNNTASHDISVVALDEGERRVVARVPVGKIPIVMAVHPSGETLWVGCEGSHELWVLDIPRPAESPAVAEPAAERPEVAVLGMIHGGHLESTTWGLDQVRETIRRLAPDVVCAEIPPDRWDRIWSEWTGRGTITDDRVRVFPETTRVLLPLAIEMGFSIEPCAAWTREMADLRRARLRQLDEDPSQSERRRAYETAKAEVEAKHRREPLDEDDPRVIHSQRYDRRTAEELAPYDTYLNDWIGPGGWTYINEAHYRLIDGVIRRHPGERILITFGAGHKYWLLERLKEREDIRLLDVAPFLPQSRSE